MTSKLLVKKGLSANQLKWIAIVCMLIDHFTWVFIPTSTILAQVLHIIGRVTGPIMFFFIAEGYEKTSNFYRYAIRLGLFAIVSAPLYMIVFYGGIYVPNLNFLLVLLVFGIGFYKNKFNLLGFARILISGLLLIPVSLLSFEQDVWLNLGVIFTLFLGLIAIHITKLKLHIFIKIPLIIYVIWLTQYGDWMIVGVIYILIFSLNYGNYKKQLFWYCLNFLTLIYVFVLNFNLSLGDYGLRHFLIVNKWNVFHIGVFIPIILLYFYNGKRTNNENQTELQKNINKWGFYVIYPAHLLILCILK